MTASTEAPTTLVFRADKDRETGEHKGWKVFGPADLMAPGRTALVTKKDGSTTEVKIGRVSKEFQVEGVWCAYGYLATEEGE